MKNIPCFALLVILAWVFFPASGLSADTADESQNSDYKTRAYSLSMAPIAGFLYGQGLEYVYKTTEYRELYSELRWDLKPLFYLGFLLDFSRAEPLSKWGFFAGAAFKFGIPAKTGKMEDRDWLGVSHSGLTHLSVHDNITEGAFWFDVNGGFTIPLEQTVLIKAGLSFSYTRFKWTARDGYFQYGTEAANDYLPWDASIPKEPLYGASIMYEQNLFILGFKAAVDFPLMAPLRGEAALTISPFIWGYAHDDHLLAGFYYSGSYNGYLFSRYYDDSFAGGLMAEWSGSLFFNLRGNKAFMLNASYRIVIKVIGSSKTTTITHDVNNGGYLMTNSGTSPAGAGLNALDVSLLFRFSL